MRVKYQQLDSKKRKELAYMIRELRDDPVGVFNAVNTRDYDPALEFKKMISTANLRRGSMQYRHVCEPDELCSISELIKEEKIALQRFSIRDGHKHDFYVSSEFVEDASGYSREKNILEMWWHASDEYYYERIKKIYDQVSEVPKHTYEQKYKLFVALNSALQTARLSYNRDYMNTILQDLYRLEKAARDGYNGERTAIEMNRNLYEVEEQLMKEWNIT